MPLPEKWAFKDWNEQRATGRGALLVALDIIERDPYDVLRAKKYLREAAEILDAREFTGDSTT
jgi:hypothetical protein